MTDTSLALSDTVENAAADTTPAGPAQRSLLSHIFFGAAYAACRFETLKLDFVAGVLDRIGDKIPYIGPATALAVGGTAKSISEGYKTMLPDLGEGHFPNPFNALSTTFNGLLDRVIDLVPAVFGEFTQETGSTSRQPQPALVPVS